MKTLNWTLGFHELVAITSNGEYLINYNYHKKQYVLLFRLPHEKAYGEVFTTNSIQNCMNHAMIHERNL